MRIAFYAPLKSPLHPTPSGDRRVARLLMDALAMAGHQVQLVSEFRSFEGSGDGVQQARLRSQGEAITAALLQVWRQGPQTEVPEIWLTYHLYYKAPDWLGPKVCAALGLPYIVVEGSMAAKRALGPWAEGHAAVLQALQSADLILCPTAEDVPALREVLLPKSRLERLPPFLDPAPYQQACAGRAAHRSRLAVAHGLKPSQPWIVVAAMMRPGDKESSYGVMAEVLSKLLDLPWQLVVAGDGPARPAICAALRAVAPGRCAFLGECDETVLAAVYAACDLCVWPAVNEAYGMAMLEAQAAGLPVVSCAVRGVPEVVIDGVTGLLSTDHDAAGIAACVRSLLQDPTRRLAMGVRASEFVAGQRSTRQASIRLQQALAGLSCAVSLVEMDS